MKNKYKLWMLYLFILIININLVTSSQTLSGWYRGDQHDHSNYSWLRLFPFGNVDQDGKNTISEMADSAKNNN